MDRKDLHQLHVMSNSKHADHVKQLVVNPQHVDKSKFKSAPSAPARKKKKLVVNCKEV